jgi:hypothetical protein
LPENGCAEITLPLEECCKTRFLALLLHRHQLLLPRLPNLKDFLIRCGLAADAQQRDNISLRYGAQLRILSPCISHPILVLSDVCRRNGDGIIVCVGVKSAGGRVAELGI